ncbi:SCO1664 family protein [Streptomyces sp. SID3343]|uniref:SCO1664 family protein n=1 Tax=Streptomyces sp. SID3343 TaxID=2690260 RepID=UPI001F411D3E|nr:SCO1664 family protein [Streptomyces sp. SID3343]
MTDTVLDAAAVPELLRRGELAVQARLEDASNATLYCVATLDGVSLPCVWKPVAGERPLWDFPDGTLAGREVAAYEVSEALGWDIVPTTVFREGPYGVGMCQVWIDHKPADDEPEPVAILPAVDPGPDWKAIAHVVVPGEDGKEQPALLVHAAAATLRRIAVFDAVINNADRKGGHLLPGPGGHVYGIDHGICFHVDDKLRTLLWGWAGEPLTPTTRAALTSLATDLDGALGVRLGELITPDEVAATRERVRVLLDTDRLPQPDGRRHVIPWPPI